jgi:hypothetical protein
MSDTTPTYVAGELVDITIRGARYEADHGDQRGFHLPNAARRIWLPLSTSVTVERIAPAEWPPRVGDLWRDRADNLWFGTPNSPYTDDTWLIGSTGQGDHASSLLKLNGPLTLVHREPQPADTEDGES